MSKDKKWRAVFNLKLEGTHTNEQIARELGCSVKDVKKVWHDAVAMLRHLHDGMLKEDETA